MRRSYLDYAMSVIVSRALPDVRDGLKPVHRRILYAMKEAGYDWNRPYRKSARVVGDVMGKYHPHGDAAIYDALVRMAQDFSMRLTLIDGQGNFGSMDGDPPAAMRYTEIRLDRAADALLEDIDKDTVAFQPSYDESSEEPTVLPARFPNLLVNGANGIAVGMATNIPTHNLGEVIDACLAYLDDPAISIDRLMQHVPGPDFPTGAEILGRAGIREAYHTGRGSVVMRGKTHTETLRKDREAIVVTEIPFQVNKARMIERIAEVVQEKIIEGISDLRDESDRDGVRVVIELKRDAMPEIVLNQLYRYTPLQTSFGVNMLALNAGRPELMTIKDVLVAFCAFREEVITRRTRFELGKAQERAHVLIGLVIAVANIDEIIALIRAAPDPTTAREGLMARAWPAADTAPLIALIDEPGRGVAADGTYRLSEAQARAILELRLQRLTGLEREKIAEEMREVAVQIADLQAILSSRARRLDNLRSELGSIREQFATPRRTRLTENEFEHDIEDLIQREDMVVTVTHGGYVKRVPLSAYRSQRRGGRGRSAMSTREEDAVSRLFVAHTHTPMLCFSTAGMAYKLKVYRLPLGTPQARGKPWNNLLPLDSGETISTLMPLPEDETSWDSLSVLFATASGDIRRNRLSDFADVRANGKIAMRLEPGDRLIGVEACSDDQDVLLATAGGKSIRFQVADLRVFTGRTSTGVRGIRLAAGDHVISLSILRHVEAGADERAAYLQLAGARRRARGEAEAADAEAVAAESEAAEAAEDAEAGADGEAEARPTTLAPERFAELEAAEELVLTLTENGFGKRSSAYEYRITNRGGQGIVNIETSGRNGTVVASFPVTQRDQIVLVTDSGRLMRCPVDDIRIAGRRTQGVVVFRVDEGEKVVSVSRLDAAAVPAEAANGEGEAADGVAAEPDAGPENGPENGAENGAENGNE
ncbi:MAG: DNA gyrase subunit A [Dongiaceae bacterium]